MDFDRDKVKDALAKLAERNVYIGTSSWKYPGWCGMLYEEDRYMYRNRFSESRFNRICLSEYAEVFKSVCVDAGYYRFPSPKYIEGLVADVPEDFRFSFKVTDVITIKKFTNLPRFGVKAGKPNEHFLDAELFEMAFLRPLEPHREKIGLLMFEFSRFYPSEFERGRDFIEALEAFLSKLPPGWQYGVEIRNQSFLHADYFAALQRCGVAHVYNNWQRMPSISAQMAMPGSRTAGDFTGARFLLTPGRGYQDAVAAFEPYHETKRVDNDARSAGAELIQSASDPPSPRRSFLYVNNRLEGNALLTIQAMLREAGLLK